MTKKIRYLRKIVDGLSETVKEMSNRYCLIFEIFCISMNKKYNLF
jgi:hypothetical protein